MNDEGKAKVHRSSLIAHRSSFIVPRSSFFSSAPSSLIVHRSSFFSSAPSSLIVHRSAFIVLFLCSVALAHPAVGIVRDSRGNIYYSDLHHVWKVAPDGSRTIAIRDVHTHQLHIDAADNLYGEHQWYTGKATNKWYHRVWRRQPNGQMSDVIPRMEFLAAYAFARDASPSMYWVETGKAAVLKIRLHDGRISSIRLKTPLDDVRWMTVTSRGTVYLVDGDDVKRVSRDGTVAMLMQSDGGRHSVMGIWTDNNENVFVAVPRLREIRKISPSGRITTIFRTGKEWSPSGGLIAPDGVMWLLEYNSRNEVRLRRVEPSSPRRANGS